MALVRPLFVFKDRQLFSMQWQWRWQWRLWTLAAASLSSRTRYGCERKRVFDALCCAWVEGRLPLRFSLDLSGESCFLILMLNIYPKILYSRQQWRRWRSKLLKKWWDEKSVGRGYNYISRRDVLFVAETNITFGRRSDIISDHFHKLWSDIGNDWMVNVIDDVLTSCMFKLCIVWGNGYLELWITWVSL